MATILNLTNKQVIVLRLTAVSGYKQSYSTTTAAFVELQPLSPDKANLFDGATGKLFNCYTDPVHDIRENDKLREIETGNVYRVKTGGVSRRTFGSIDFVHIVVEQIN